MDKRWTRGYVPHFSFDSFLEDDQKEDEERDPCEASNKEEDGEDMFSHFSFESFLKKQIAESKNMRSIKARNQKDDQKEDEEDCILLYISFYISYLSYIYLYLYLIYLAWHDLYMSLVISYI